GLTLLNSQYGVEEKHALIRPRNEITMIRSFDADVRFDLLEDIHERRRGCHTGANGKTQPVRLTRPVVRILTKNDDLHLVKRRMVKGSEPLVRFWIDLFPGIQFFFEKDTKVLHIGSRKLLYQLAFPTRFDLHVQGGHT